MESELVGAHSKKEPTGQRMPDPQVPALGNQHDARVLAKVVRLHAVGGEAPQDPGQLSGAARNARLYMDKT